jgi:hypothetical protein
MKGHTERHQALYRYRARFRASAGLLDVKLVCARRAAIVVIVALLNSEDLGKRTVAQPPNCIAQGLSVPERTFHESD